MVDTRLASQGSLHVGDRVRILTIAGPAMFTISGIAGPAPSHELPEQSAVFFRTDEAAQLSGSGDRVDLLGIITRPGRIRRRSPMLFGSSLTARVCGP